MNLRKLLSIILMFGITASFAQTGKITLTGKVADSTSNQSLAFCTIQIFAKGDTTKRLDATTTDIDGNFAIKRFKQEPSVMKITYSGYGTLTFDLDFSKIKNDTLNLDTIFIKSNNIDLGTAKVVAKKPRFEMDVDKLTMNIDEGLSDASENAFDLLKKTPGVSIDQDENITLNGQSGVRFQFSGKDMKLDWDAIKSMLKSMTPEKIEKIEVISNPSAKYDSDGASGIINIIFDRQKNYGINGDIGAGASYDVAWDYSGDASLSYMDSKWTLSVWGDYSWGNDRGLGYWSKNKKWREGEDTVLFYSVQPENEATDNGVYGGFYGDYTIDSNNLIGFSIYYNKYSNPEYTTVSDTWISTSQDYEQTDSMYHIDNSYLYSNKSLRGGLNYIHSFDTNDTKLSSDLDFAVQEQNTGNFQEYNYYLGNDLSNWIRRKGQTADVSRESRDLSWKIDFQKKIFKDGTLEAGAKLALSNNNNDCNAQINNDSVYINDTNRTNNFKYTENIYALYLSYSHKFGKKINLRAGVRGEYTYTIGEQSINNEKNTLQYPNLFPNIRISYLVNEKNRFTLGYNYRISRPWYSRLNPFVSRQSDYSETQGNPALKPSYNHNISLSHSWNYCLNTSLSYTYTTDAIVDVPELKPNSMITVSKPQNLTTAHSLGLYVSFNKNITEKFHCYLSAGGRYNSSRYLSNNKLADINSFGANGWANVSYQLPLKINLSMQGYIFWNQGLSVSKSSPWQNISLSVNRAFFDNSLRLSISATNLLSVKTYKTSYDTPYTSYESESKEAGIGVRFRVSYNFGKMYERQKLTKIQSDDNNDRSK
ncbi:MAG: TonB-dependent receptor [Bacteroidales bacterium]|nr:TonB-dependent receptor [Bacteroidales bacterium]